MKIKGKYEGQALAIAMVVLVVSSILGISIYSRITKDKAQALDERASAEALEVSDLIIDYVTKYELDDVITGMEEIANTTMDYENGITLTESSGSQISLLLTHLGETQSLQNLDICSIAQSGNEYFFNVKMADFDTYFEVRPGQVFSLPIRGVALADGCTASIKAAVRGDSQSGFSITRIYATGYNSDGLATDYKPYEISDTTNYCFSSDGVNCNSDNFTNTDAWVKFRDDNSETLSPSLNETVDGYQLDEIRIKAVGGTVGIAYQLPSACIDGLRLIDIQVGANCNGVYRGKEVLIPEKKWSSTIFDYVFFNGEGSL